MSYCKINKDKVFTRAEDELKSLVSRFDRDPDHEVSVVEMEAIANLNQLLALCLASDEHIMLSKEDALFLWCGDQQ